MYLLAAVFIYFAKIEAIKLDKITGLLTLSKYVLVFRQKVTTYPIADIVKIDLYGAGRKNIHENSVHYKVQIKMRTGQVLKILETKGKLDGYRKAVQIKNFLQITEEIELSNNVRIDL